MLCLSKTYAIWKVRNSDPYSTSIINRVKIKEKPEEKLLEKEKLKELAGEYWEKKKNTKMTASKGQ